MASQPGVRFGSYRLEEVSGQLWRHTQVVHLPPKASAVLWRLATQAGEVVSREHLLATVWAGTVVSDAVLTVCVRELRRVLGDDAKRPRYIETVHRRGYRFMVPVERFETAAAVERAAAGDLPTAPAAWLGWGQCVETHGRETGYLPLLEAQGRLCRGSAGPMVLEVLRKWALTLLVQLPGVLSVAEQGGLQRRAEGEMGERILRELAAALEALTQAQLGVLVLEDLH
jgi:DNA-binding winged helix-turn-helix (wHTH) protein